MQQVGLGEGLDLGVRTVLDDRLCARIDDPGETNPRLKVVLDLLLYV